MTDEQFDEMSKIIEEEKTIQQQYAGLLFLISRVLHDLQKSVDDLKSAVANKRAEKNNE